MSRNHAAIKNDPRWKAVRLQALARDGHACRVCGTEEELEVDHIIGLEEDLDLAFELDNLQTLCRPHHQQKGRERLTIKRNTWINPAFPELYEMSLARS